MYQFRRPIGENAARVGQRDAASPADKQRPADIALKFGERPAKRRLR